MSRQHPIITLTTDFGVRDPYVGQLKGSLLKGCPQATLVDLSHAIGAWDVEGAALTLSGSYACFPPGSVHLVVVDPEVGSDRSILVAAGSGHCFVAPDNGILAPLAANGALDSLHRLEDPAFFSTPISPTFHGRDLMAPVAAALACGRLPASFGPPVALAAIRRLEVSPVLQMGDELRGQVLRIDRFGNVRTSIRADHPSLKERGFGWAEISGQRLSRFGAVYTEVEEGGLLVLVDSGGYLEVAANRQSAAERLGCRRGDPVTIHFHG